MIEVEKVGPTGLFTNYIYKAIPLAFDESMSYYECLCGLLDYMKNTMIPALNNNADAVTELQNFYEELETYVNNYLNDETIQPLINNKLDEYVTDGTMERLINQEVFSDLNNRVTLLDTKKFVLIGDSYLEGYTPDGNVTSWGTLFKQYLGLSDSQVITSYLGGSSFAGTKSFTNLVNALTNDDMVTDIIIAGGYNDRTFNRTQINTGMVSFKNACHSKFPNAKIHLAMIGWSNNSEYLYSLYNTCINYKYNASQNNIGFMSGTEYSLHDYFSMFSSDGIHPNATGQQSIARNIVNSYLQGNADVFYSYKSSNFTASGSCTGTNTGSSTISVEINNNIAQISCQGVLDFIIDSISYNATGKNDIEIATLTNGYVVGSNYKMLNVPVQLIVHDTSPGTYYKVNGILTIRNGKIYISFADINDNGNNYRSFTSINQIQVMPFSCTFDSLFC